MEAWQVALAVYAVYAVPVGIFAVRMVSRSGVEVEDRFLHTLREAGLPAEEADPEEGDGPVRRVLRRASFTTHSLFVNRTKLTSLQRVGLSIGALTLFPIRLILFPLCLAIAAVFARLAVAGLPRGHPLTSWPRLALRELMCCMIRAAVLSLGLWVRSHGRRASKEEAPLIVANHYAFFDADLPPRIRAAPLSAKKNEQLPFVAAIMQCLQVCAAASSVPAGPRTEPLPRSPTRCATGRHRGALLPLVARRRHWQHARGGAGPAAPADRHFSGGLHHQPRRALSLQAVRFSRRGPRTVALTPPPLPHPAAPSSRCCPCSPC